MPIVAYTSQQTNPERGSPHWWNERYQGQDTPWDTGIVPPELLELVDTGLLQPPGVALDLGCGTGTNINYLAQLGFRAIGVDLSWLAVCRARDKAMLAGLPSLFCAGDVSELGFLAVQGNFVLDMGCLHNLSSDRRAAYATSLARRTAPGGLYLLYGFDAVDDPAGGPTGFADGEIAARFFPDFRLEWRRRSTQGERAVAWYLLRRL